MNIPDTWIVTTVGKLCDQGGGSVQTGPFGSQLHAEDYKSDGVPVVMPQNLGRNKIETTDIARIDDQDVKRLAQHRLETGDIVFPRRGDVSRYAYITKEYEGWLCGTGCLRIRLGKSQVDPKYLAYYLGRSETQNWIIGNAVGTTMLNLNTSIVRALPVVVPPLDEQRAIAHILGTLDDKIELNRRMNATLEAIARAIFQSWFVDFDPVRAKMRGEQPYGMDAETAALFPDAFEDSELGPIPAGWGVGTLGDIADNSRRGIKPQDMDPGTLYIGLEHMPQKSIALDSWSSASDVASNKFLFRQGEFLFGKLRPYFHKVGVAPDDGVCSTDILVIVPSHEIWYGLTLCYISSKEFIDYTTAASIGTRMPRTNWDTMSKYPVVIPEQNVAENFNRVVHPMLDTIQNNIWQSSTLAELRDALLPKLISGNLHSSA